ncbi:MAG: type II toxin-antitoxin system RelE/ParE family toxin [Candidatus Aenigmarchaeota archaeon]|nr:type II toxin-antitoxin system RelE/ParE family toxin [Candidatus Aenigmarchaeota archaeon]
MKLGGSCVMSFIIRTTEQFEKYFDKLDNSIRLQIIEKAQQLKMNPYLGTPLGYDFFREKRVMNYRFYYLIYGDMSTILFMAISSKKDQQQVIDRIQLLIPFYKEEIRKQINASKF